MGPADHDHRHTRLDRQRKSRQKYYLRYIIPSVAFGTIDPANPLTTMVHATFCRHQIAQVHFEVHFYP